MKRWFAVLLMVILLFVPQAQAKDNQDPETCERRDLCWEGQSCICDYSWLFTLAFGVVSVDVTCEDGSPKAEQLVQIRRESLGLEREKITNAQGNVKFVTGVGKYSVLVEGEEQKVNVYGMLATKNVAFNLICFPTTTTTVITTTIPRTTIPTTTIEPTTTTSVAGVPHTTTIYKPGHGGDRPTTTTAKVTTSIPEETTTVPIETTSTTSLRGDPCERACHILCPDPEESISIKCPEPTTTTTIDCYDQCIYDCNHTGG